MSLSAAGDPETGLAIDLALNAPDIDFICPEFPRTGICRKFRELAPYYGFIERYQKAKEPITGISEEPWHFRYVGTPHSVVIAENGLSLEEYIERRTENTQANSRQYLFCGNAGNDGNINSTRRGERKAR